MLRLLLLPFLFLTLSVSAQEKAIPYLPLSPIENVEIRIGLVEFELTYSCPSIRGRTVFGELVPYGELWRTGANKNIKLSFNDAVNVGNQTLSAGDYTILTIPEKDEWTIRVYDHIDAFGIPKWIDTLTIISEFKIPSQMINPTVESMKITFENIRHDAVDLFLRWENTAIAIPIKMHTDRIIRERISAQNEMLASDYATAAFIYFDKEKNYPAALSAVNKSIEIKQGGNTFEEWLEQVDKSDRTAPWAHLTKAELLAIQGDIDQAIKVANQALQIANVIDSPFYVNAVNKLLKEWK